MGCFRCSSDEYALQGNTAACITCPDGHTTDTGDGDAGTSCAPCAAGRTFAEGECHDCEKGFWSPETNTPVECVACVKGKYGDQVARGQESDCKNCVAGKYNNIVGIADASLCKDCPQGYVGFSGGGGGGRFGRCLLFLIYFFLFLSVLFCGGLVVSLSPRRQYGSQDRLIAEGDNNVRSCLPCGGGKYGTQPGFDDPRDCTNCPIGTYLIAGGSTAVEDCKYCPRGFYGYREGEWQTCKSCPIGKFLSSVNSTDPNDCDDCPSTWLLLLCRFMWLLMRLLM